MRTFLTILILVLAFRVSAQLPTDNPYLSFYPDVNHHWSQQINWHNIHSITEYTGATWDDQLDNAQADLASQGGGIIYFPAGEYQFKEDINLKSCIILRGATPTNQNATVNNFAPPTRFIFPKYNHTETDTGGDVSTAFKRIRSEFNYYGLKTTMPKDTIRNTGLVYIDINRANLIFHPSYVNYIPSGSGSSNVIPCYMENVIIFGIRNNNVAFPIPFIPNDYQNEWQRWPWRYIANLDALAQKNLTICNNRFNDFTNNTSNPISNDHFDQNGYIVKDLNTSENDTIMDGSKARFEYTNHYGLVANRFYNYYTLENGHFSSGDLLIIGDYAAEISDSNDTPALFYKNVEIKNNYMYNTQQVAFFVAGMGMVIKDNVIKDKPDKKQWISRSGYYNISYDAYLENRGIDFSGTDIRIENNDVQVYSTQFKNSAYSSNDGEGIMIQECCGGSKPNEIHIRNNKLEGNNAYIGLYKTRDIQHVEIEKNNMGSKNIYVNANTNNNNHTCFDVHIKNNYNVGNITLRGDLYGDSCSIKGNIGTGSIDANCYVTVEDNTGLTYTDCVTLPGDTLPDSTCFTFDGTEYCSPNMDKAIYLCLEENGFPEMKFNNADTIFIDNNQTITLNPEIISSSVDSFCLLQNRENIGCYNKAQPIDVFINKKGSTFFRMQAFGCSVNMFPKYQYSAPVCVINNSYDITKLQNPYAEETVKRRSVKISPNPSNGLFRIKQAKHISNLTIYTPKGQIIKKISSHGTTNKFDLSSFPKGIYFVRIENTQGNTVVKKIIVY